MKKKMNKYLFDIKDYRADVWHLPRLHRGIYRELIDEYYLHESALVDDVHQLAHKLAIRSDEEKEALEQVLNEFFIFKNGKFHHKRIAQEIKNYQYRHQVLSNEDVTRDGVTRNVSNITVTDSVTESNNGVTGGVTHSNAGSNAQRQAKLRYEKRVLKSWLEDKNIDFNKEISKSDLSELVERNGGNVTEILKSNSTVTGGVTGGVTESNSKNAAINIKHNINTHSLSREGSGDFESSEILEKTKLPENLPFSENSESAEPDFGLPFAMSLSWSMPNDLHERLRLAGVLLPPDSDVIADAFVNFKNHHSATGKTSNQEGWVAKLISWILADYRKWQSQRKNAVSVVRSAGEVMISGQEKTAVNKPLSATKTSILCLDEAVKAVEDGRVVVPLPKPVFNAIGNGLKKMIVARLPYPPSADTWAETLNFWVEGFARHRQNWCDDDAQRVESAFNSALTNARNNAENARFPSVDDVIQCLPMRLVQAKLEHALSSEEWEAKCEVAKSNTANILKKLGKKVHA